MILESQHCFFITTSSNLNLIWGNNKKHERTKRVESDPEMENESSILIFTIHKLVF